MTAALFRYRLEARDPLPTSIPSRLLQHTLPIAPPDPVDAAGQGAVHEFKAHHPPLTAPGSNYGLSHTECRAEFPRLFDDLDRSVALRRELGNVSLADVDLAWKPHGAVRVMIYNHRVPHLTVLLGLLNTTPKLTNMSLFPALHHRGEIQRKRLPTAAPPRYLESTQPRHHIVPLPTARDRVLLQRNRHPRQIPRTPPHLDLLPPRLARQGDVADAGFRVLVVAA